MSIKFTQLGKILTVTTIACLVSGVAQAEKKPLDQKFQDAYFNRGKDAFHQSSIVGQVNTLFGFTGFPEQHISSDAKTVDEVYRKGMARQSSMAPRVITRDLANPYDTSILENPSFSAVQ